MEIFFSILKVKSGGLKLLKSPNIVSILFMVVGNFFLSVNFFFHIFSFLYAKISLTKEKDY